VGRQLTSRKKPPDLRHGARILQGGPVVYVISPAARGQRNVSLAYRLIVNFTGGTVAIGNDLGQSLVGWLARTRHHEAA